MCSTELVYLEAQEISDEPVSLFRHAQDVLDLLLILLNYLVPIHFGK